MKIPYSIKDILYREDLYPKTKKSLGIIFMLFIWYFQFTGNLSMTFVLIVSVTIIAIIYFSAGAYLFRKRKDIIYLTIWIILLAFGFKIYINGF
jgi:hypothetical protein